MSGPRGAGGMSRVWRFTPFVALTAAVLLLVAAVVIGIYADRDYRNQKTEAARVQAEIVAQAVTAALAFNDPKAAATYVGALGANPLIAAAAVYNSNGQMFASFRRETAGPLPAAPPATPVTYGSVRVGVAVPVVQAGSRLGTVYLRAATQSFAQRLTQVAGLVFLGIMALLVLAVLGLAQAVLNRANDQLARHAADLEDANLRLREQIAEREKAEEALRQAQKMESIGQLTGGVAHDFNNLLAIILGNLERAERRLAAGADAAQIRRIIANAKAGADRAALLTRSLLAFSRRQPLQPQPVDVNRLVSGMSELLRRTLGEQITVETVVAGGLWRTSVDPNQLESAILNLAVNARDAMPEGGKLTIETANAFLDEAYAAAQEDVEPGQYVVLCITDTGAGMSREVMDKAFEPFFTTKDVGHGTGLGLSQVYGLVKQSGGHVKIYSEPGEGTTIKIYLPRLVTTDEPAAAPTPEPASAHPPAPRAGAVLIVEDDDGVREHSAAILTELGYRVFQAANGADGLAVLDRHPDIALLFTDVGLPGGMNGRQLADEATRRHPGLAVLYTTGYARNAIVHDGRLDPGVRLVTKPFTFAQLAKGVAETLRPTAPEVLVVEDEMLVRTATAELVGELGCVAIEATTAAEAQSILRLKRGAVAAALVDLGLPDSKGDAIVADLRAAWPDLAVIVASGAAGTTVRAALADDPKVSFLPKPYGPDQLEAALRKAGVAVAAAEGGTR